MTATNKGSVTAVPKLLLSVSGQLRGRCHSGYTPPPALRAERNSSQRIEVASPGFEASVSQVKRLHLALWCPSPQVDACCVEWKEKRETSFSSTCLRHQPRSLDTQCNMSEEEVIRHHQPVSVWCAAFVVHSHAIFSRLNKLTGSSKASHLTDMFSTS